MSLYNMLFGYNPLTGVVLSSLNLDTTKIPRFRDAYFEGDNNRLVIFTRTGGGNRDYYESVESRRADWWGDDEPTEEDLEGPYNEDLRNHPNFISDEDDDFDCTYAYFYYSIPESFTPIFETLKDLAAGKEPNPMVRFKKMIEDLDSGQTTPETIRAMEVGTALVEAIVRDTVEE